MNMTRGAIERKRITFAALLIVLFAGISTYRTMSRAEDPGFIVRTALVQTVFPGASPERVEQLITDKLEKRLQEMPELESIESTSKPGISVIYVNIKESYDEMRPIWDNLRRKVDRAREDLPDGIIGPVVNDEFGDVFGTIVAITGDGYSYAELKEIADDTRNELLLIEEVAKVDIHGAQEERIFVEFNNVRLAELGVSPGQLRQILQARNIIFPGGTIYTGDEQIVLEPTGAFDTIDELRETVIRFPGRNEILYLRDVAEITRGYVDPPQSLVHHNGTPALALAISMREGGNIITLGEAVQAQVRRFQETYPIGVDFDFVYFQPDYVEKKVKDFTVNLVQAIVIVIAVMLVTLGIRTGLVVATLIPMAMVSALMVMGFLDIGLDQMSLAALIIALGLLVDNAIVMSESIMVQMSEGKKAIDAALAAAAELRVPLLTSSITTAAAFLPIYLAESSVGEYTAPIFEVVSITLLCSWILALTMTPLLCVLFLKVKPSAGGSGYDSRFYRRYRGALVSMLRRPILSLIGVIVIFFGVMSLFRFVPQIFFPGNDKPIMQAEFIYPLGTPIEKTRETIREIETFIRDEMLVESGSGQDGVTQWTTFVGAGAPRFQLAFNPEPPSPEYAFSLIHTTSRDLIETDFVPKLERFCADRFPDLRPNITPLFLGPPTTAPVEVRVMGKETDDVFALVDLVKERLREIPGTKNIRDDWGNRTKKLVVNVDQPRAQRSGLTSEDIAISLQTILSGIETTDFREGDDNIPITLRSTSADRRDIGKLESHNIFVQTTGRAVPLKQVADIEVVWQPSRIKRYDRLKAVTVAADITPGTNAIAIALEIDAWLAPLAKDWPIGYSFAHGGEYESSVESQESIAAKFPIAALLIVLLLVAQFDSIRRPLIILLTIPLGLIGVVIGLLITQFPFGFMALLGIVSLAGIVINNAIVLIDRIKIEIEENGHPPPKAIVEAAQRRLRPILLTTATTVGGLVPLWIGGGALFESMAVAILFGLLFATVLTLGVVPILYTILFRVSFRGFRYERS